MPSKKPKLNTETNPNPVRMAFPTPLQKSSAFSFQYHFLSIASNCKVSGTLVDGENKVY
jgi:hypothetical protein